MSIPGAEEGEADGDAKFHLLVSYFSNLLCVPFLVTDSLFCCLWIWRMVLQKGDAVLILCLLDVPTSGSSCSVWFLVLEKEKLMVMPSSSSGFLFPPLSLCFSNHHPYVCFFLVPLQFFPLFFLSLLFGSSSGFYSQRTQVFLVSRRASRWQGMTAAIRAP